MKFKNWLRCKFGYHDRCGDDWESYCKRCGKAWLYDLEGGMPSNIVGGECNIGRIVGDIQKGVFCRVLVIWGEEII
jgi:hypothetical protein